MTTSYQDVARANGVLAGWALTEAAGLSFAPWVGGASLVGTGGFLYRQAGPFASAFGLHLNAGATVRLPFIAPLQAPTTFEVWAKLNGVTPSAQAYPFYSGNPSANGSGVYVATNGHVHFLEGGVVDTDTTVLWPSAGWHLVQMVSFSSTLHAILIDGATIYQATQGGSLAPVNNSLAFGCDSNNGAAAGIDIAYPALYATALNATSAYSTFLAATDPDSAIGFAASGGGNLAQQILAAVRKVY